MTSKRDCQSRNLNVLVAFTGIQKIRLFAKLSQMEYLWLFLVTTSTIDFTIREITVFDGSPGTQLASTLWGLSRFFQTINLLLLRVVLAPYLLISIDLANQTLHDSSVTVGIKGTTASGAKFSIVWYI